MNRAIIAAFAVFGVLSFARLASADTEEPACAIGTVGVNVEGDRQVYVSCTNDNTTYIAYQTSTPAGNCPVVDTDALKEFESMAISAKLAGKTLDIWWNTFTCGGQSVRVIRSMMVH